MIAELERASGIACHRTTLHDLRLVYSRQFKRQSVVFFDLKKPFTGRDARELGVYLFPYTAYWKGEFEHCIVFDDHQTGMECALAFPRSLGIAHCYRNGEYIGCNTLVRPALVTTDE